MSADPAALSTRALPGVGPAREACFARLGVRNLRDLMLLVPRRLERWEEAVPAAAARARIGEDVCVRGTVRSRSFVRAGRGRSLLRVVLADGSGELELFFFNQPWMRERLAAGVALEARGRVVARKGKPAGLAVQRAASGEERLPAPGTLEASYPSTEGLSQQFIAAACRGAAREHAAALAEPLPPRLLAGAGLPPLADAVRALHAPGSLEAFERARRRTALEPLLELQARLWRRRHARVGGRALPLAVDDALHARLLARFPFAPTPGQLAALADLRADLGASTPMRRLLQGDVGSGKTAVGVYACMAAAAHGAQALFLAPTELLAEQHLASQGELLARANLRAALMTGSQPAAQRRKLEQALARGELDVLFGTHALLSEGVRPGRLALAVIDEQHRFGVAQRQRLLEKGGGVHALLMTATPIPRSLALTLYGDLELSVLAGRPAGRADVETRWLRGPERKTLLARLEERLGRGERVYWVVPRIDATSADEKGASARHAWLAQRPLARHGLELVHGRLPSRERARRLERFRRGEAGLLVATTLVEVGVDVPEASAMVIEDAQRLGLAQLHQLRGRVGRGTSPSACYLLSGERTGEARERLELLERERDGFVLAEADLERRGMGDLSGERQAGDNAEGLADAAASLELLQLARAWIEAEAGVREVYLGRVGEAEGA